MLISKGARGRVFHVEEKRVKERVFDVEEEKMVRGRVFDVEVEK